MTGMSSKDKFFTIDNGHLNFKPQSNLKINKTMMQILISREIIETLGPASYLPSKPLGKSGNPNKISGAIVNSIKSV
jgi:hypothetical protein